MITAKKHGDITSQLANPDADIIIAMNPEFKELTKLAKQFVGKPYDEYTKMGSVLTFKFDDKRRLHMVICHELRKNGWKNAYKFLRIGLDRLWLKTQTDWTERKFAIVQIGDGVVGRKYGANVPALEKAIAESFLPVTLFKLGDTAKAAVTTPFPPSPLVFEYAIGSTVYKTMKATAQFFYTDAQQISNICWASSLFLIL